MTNLKKKLTLLLIALFAALCLGLGFLFIPKPSPSAATAEVTLSSLNDFKIDENGVFSGLTQQGVESANGKKFKIELPSSVKVIGTGYSASSPTQNALFGSYASNLVEVAFAGNQLEKIERYAFNGCSSLGIIDLEKQENLKTVEEGAFKGCSSLINITLPSQVNTFAKELFMGCSTLKSVTTKNDNIAVISESAFENCYNLSAFKFPANLTTIGTSAFAGCQNLENIVLPDSAVNIGASAFARCTALKTIRISDGVLRIEDSTFEGCNRLVRIYTDKEDTASVFKLPSGITYIGKSAFESCIALTEITVPSTVTNINERAFFSCSGVKHIYYYAEKATLSTGQTNTFGVSSGVYADVTVHIGGEGNPVKNLSPNLFSGHPGIKQVIFKNVDLSGGKGENGWGASTFSGCSSLEKVVFDTDCTIPVINARAFADCVNLTDITGIENLADTTGIENIGLGTIGTEAFSNCRSLRTFTIGSDVSNIESNAFLGCRKLVEVKNLSEKDSTNDTDKFNFAKLKAGDRNGGLVANYALRVYKDGKSNIDASSDYIFYVDTEERKETWLLDYVGKATDITLPAGYGAGGVAYNIYNDAFIGKTSLTDIVIPEGSQVKRIGDSAFAGCTALTHISFPSTALTLGEHLLQGCTSLTNVNFNTPDPTSETGLNIISANMFAGCTSLRTITLPRNIRTIEHNAFENCTSLTTVTFGGGLTGANKVERLTNIEAEVFKGCTSLEVMEIPFTVTKIGQSAFAGCNSLRFVYLPQNTKAQAATYGANVFGEISGDRSLMLISGGNYVAKKTETDAQAMAKRKECYDNDTKTANLSAYAQYLTYIVDVKLIYEDGVASNGVHIAKKLYNRDAGYEQIGLVWNMSASMPTQGTLFVESVWYKTKNEDGTLTDRLGDKDKTAIEVFTEMLKEDKNDIVLYAHYISKPSLTQLDATVAYDEQKSYTIKQVFTDLLKEDTDYGKIDSTKFDDFNNKYQFNITSHTFINGNKNDKFTWDPQGVIQDAGTYVLEIKLKENYGTWATPCTVTFTINPKLQDISKAIKWTTENGALGPDKDYDSSQPNTEQYVNSISQKLYFYPGGTVPYSTEEKDKNMTVRYVLGSCVAYQKDVSVMITLGWVGDRYGIVDENSYKGNVGENSDTYVATALIRPDNNYLLTFTSDAWTRAFGYDFKRAADGSVTVSKTWYIYADSNNRLLASDGIGDFDFRISDESGKETDWVYNKVKSEQVPKAPAVLYGTASSLLSYSLQFNGEMVTEKDENRGIVELTNETAWSQYINSSLPAGDYILTIYIAPCKIGDKTYSSDTKVFEFTVKEATVTNSDRKNVLDTLSGTDGKKVHNVEYTEPEGKVSFVDTSGLNLFKKGKDVQFNSGTGVGYWQYRTELYTAFEARYYVVEAGKDYPDKNYYTAQKYAEDYAAGIRTRACPVGIGTYTIYYIIDAPNYEGEITGSYTLNITHTLKKITIGELNYSGVSLLPEIDGFLRRGNSEIFDEYSFLDVYTLTESSKGATPDTFFSKYGKLEGDTYTDVGVHVVFVGIKEIYKNYILWDSSISADSFDFGFVKGINRKFLVVSIKISATSDYETADGKLYVNSWEYGMFSREENSPHWKLQLNTDASTYKFELISADGLRKYYFNNDPEAPLDGQGFIYAPAGHYTLKAISPELPDKNLGKYESQIDIEVKKATPVFNEVPYIDSWNYGNTSNVQLPNLSEALAGFGNLISEQIEIYYCLRAEYDKVSGVPKLYTSLDEMKNSEGYIPAGEYYVIYRLAETDNFAQWEYKIRFKVLQAINSWKSLYVPDFDYVEYDTAMKLMEAIPNYGDSSRVFVQFRIKGADSAFRSLDQLLNIEGKLDIGTYEMRAILAATENFARMESVTTFTVSRASNEWIDVPSIRGWAEGNYSAEKNGIIAKAAVGNVELTITDENGKEYSTHDLGSLGIGTYKLTARVAGTNNYDELVSEIYFDVIEDSVGMKGLIAATVVFSVLALGLAGAAIALLVLRNKKAEREFRKAVRNELRRK